MNETTKIIRELLYCNFFLFHNFALNCCILVVASCSLQSTSLLTGQGMFIVHICYRIFWDNLSYSCGTQHSHFKESLKSIILFGFKFSSSPSTNCLRSKKGLCYEDENHDWDTVNFSNGKWVKSPEKIHCYFEVFLSQHEIILYREFISDGVLLVCPPWKWGSISMLSVPNSAQTCHEEPSTVRP